MEGTSVAAQAIQAVTDGLTSLAGTLGDTIIALTPVALGVVAAFIAVKFGIKFFRTLIKE